MNDADAATRLRESLDAQLRLHEEHARLQDSLIEMLNLELRECRRRLVEQGAHKTELDRQIKVHGEQYDELKRERERLRANYQGLHSPPPSGSLAARLYWATSRIGGVLSRLFR
jgi:DNA repair exonuclease SbcCD ATPase subunit